MLHVHQLKIQLTHDDKYCTIFFCRIDNVYSLPNLCMTFLTNVVI